MAKEESCFWFIAFIEVVVFVSRRLCTHWMNNSRVTFCSDKFVNALQKVYPLWVRLLLVEKRKYSKTTKSFNCYYATYALPLQSDSEMNSLGRYFIKWERLETTDVKLFTVFAFYFLIENLISYNFIFSIINISINIFFFVTLNVEDWKRVKLIFGNGLFR